MEQTTTTEIVQQRPPLEFRETKKIDRLVYVLRTFQENDLDSVNVVSGPKGFGKSVLSLQAFVRYMRRFGCKCKKCQYTWVWKGKMVQYIRAGYTAQDTCLRCGELTRVGMSLGQISEKVIWKYICYSEDIFNKIRQVEEFSFLIADESVNFAMGEDWMFAQNKAIKKLFAQCRTKHLIIFMNIPKFKWLQSKYRDDMANAWFRIITRGLCVMMLPDLGEGDDSWHMKDYEKYLGTYNYLSSKTELVSRLRKLKAKHPCYYDHFHIPRLPEEFYQRYLRIRNAVVFRRDDKDIMAHNLHKLMLFNLRFRWSEFIKQTKGMKEPTAKIVSQLLFYDHAKQQSILKPEQVRKFILEMRDHFEELAEAEKRKKLHYE